MSKSMPYFDYIFSAIDNGFEPLEKTFGHHVHWGYWEFPEQATLTQDDFSEAAENLSQLIYASAQVTNAQVILDVGCGFGGTISSLNNQYQGMELIGLNIDERQIARARQRILPVGNNKIEFQQGDACSLPFADNSIDVVLAVECIFHFPSREQFIKEAYRVLKPGGYLALSDFLLSKKISRFHNLRIFRYLTNGFFGSCNVQYTKKMYQELALQNNFSIECEKNITRNTLPTYRFLMKLARTVELYKMYRIKIFAFAFTIRCIEKFSKMNALGYFVYSLKKPLINPLT